MDKLASFAYTAPSTWWSSASAGASRNIRQLYVKDPFLSASENILWYEEGIHVPPRVFYVVPWHLSKSHFKEIELGGSGIFRPEVTIPAGLKYPVMAWGLGLERLAMFLQLICYI